MPLLAPSSLDAAVMPGAEAAVFEHAEDKQAQEENVKMLRMVE